MGKFTLAGGDVHDGTILEKVAVDRDRASKRSWVNDRDGRRAMIVDLKRRAAEAGAKEIWFAYEASGVGFGLYDELTEAGIHCVVLAPSKLRKSAQERRCKTDEKDAERLLEVLRGHVLGGSRLPEIWVPDVQTRDDRELVRARLDVGEKTSSVKAQVKALLKRNGVVRALEAGENWSQDYWRWLQALTQEGSVLRTGARSGLQTLLAQLDWLDEEARRLDRAIGDLAKEGRYAGSVGEMRRLKGAGLLVAMVFLTEMGDPRRFRNRRQVSAYLGLVPCAAESGEQNDRKGHITREGPARLRKMLCQGTWARIKHDPEEKEFYRRLAERNPKHKKKAVVAVMRRLGVRLWHAAMRGMEVAG